ncbi:MAG: hypothetical protein A2107_07950 [Verrucomicrobia bacterium GWF2_62_7]|nr:MAG: hypothetical protein A2107_07950 [Verrucomicrobia bacterium GWF2_62_7]
MLLLALNAAYAWLRPQYEDAVVVERSQLIVVAHLKEGSIQYVPHNKRLNEGAIWEHHATLVITDVLKGKCDKKEIPIIIHYGLTPVVGGYVKRDNFMINYRVGKDEYPKDIIEVFDTGNSCRGLPSLVKDARQDNLWFLRKRSGAYGRDPGTEKYGIVDPEDLQPLKWKDYLVAYMANDPEIGIKQHAKRNPDIAGRAKRYLDHLEVRRILKVECPKTRCDKLLPFFLNHTTWNMKSEARAGIISCGKIAGELLSEVFNDPDHSECRVEIIFLWRDVGYRNAVPLLIDLLKKHDEFWAQQDLQKGWWNRDVNSDKTRRRRNIYSEVYYSVCVLRSFKDRMAKDALKITRDRWKAIDFDNPQIVEECEVALRELSAIEGTAPQSDPANVSKPRR